MDDFAQTMAGGKDLTEEEQKKAGTPVSGSMDEGHKKFLEELIALIDSGEINPVDPQTFLKHDVYDALDEEWKDKTDLALTNIASQIQRIEEFYRSEETPDESPQLDTMVAELWQMKQHIEETHDVFKF